MSSAVRNRQLTDLQLFFAECVKRNGQVVLISGDQVSGKTELVRRLLDHAEQRGSLVLSATGSRAESTVRMGVTGQLFRSAELPPPLYDRVSGLIGFDDPSRQAAPEAARLLCRALLEVCRDRTVVVAVDDTQFADWHSLQVLLCLQRHLKSAPILVVLTEWDRPWPTSPCSRAELTRGPHHRITLDPLSADGVADLHGHAAELLHQRGSSAVARHLVAADRAPGEWAIDVLCDAAEQWLAGDEVEQAVLTTVEVVVAALRALVSTDQTSRAAWWCDWLLSEAVQRKAVTWQAILGGIRAEIAFRQGDLVLARSRAEVALGLLSAQSWGVLIGLPLSTLLLTYTAMGRYELAAGLTRQATSKAMFDTVFGRGYLHARGHYYLATNQAISAVTDFQSCASLMSCEPKLDVPATVPWRSDLAQAFLVMRRHKEARKLVSQQLELVGGANSRTRGISLRVLAASSDLKRRLPLLREAIDLLRGCGDRLELARALADLSRVHQELGELGKAQMIAHRAAREAEACHAEPLRERVTKFGTRIEFWPEVDSTATCVLSDAEHRVAGLAVLGYTNREIGDRLHITISTVEQHLTRVYRKLNVNNRAALVSSAPLRPTNAPFGYGDWPPVVRCTTLDDAP